MNSWEILVLFNCNHARWVDVETARDAKENGAKVFCHRCTEFQTVKRNVKKRRVGA